jgi:non-specific serine/threonine protein kinase
MSNVNSPSSQRSASGKSAELPLSAKDAAAALGVSERTIRRAIDRGDLAATKVGGVYRVTGEQLAAYRAKRERAPSPAALAPVSILPPVVAVPPPLPAPPTVLLGREREATDAGELLMGGARLLTLVGLGGVGKTRLALAIAESVAESYPGGVWWVPLAAIADPAMVPAAVARVLGMRDGGERPLAERMALLLRGQPALLVLDNVEQVIEAAVEIARWLAANPGLHVLVTSREPLNLAAETTFPVPPLATPDPATENTLSAMAASPAVRLFVARAASGVPGFRLDEGNAEAISAICRRLDGLPLAIELAATRVRVLPPADLLARLGTPLPLLVGGPRDAPARHQTMRDAIAWSYDLLRPEEQALFRTLAVFAGGAPVEAIESIRPGEEIINRLASLVDKQLVTVDPTATTRARVLMLETVREFAIERMTAEDDAEELRRKHALWFWEFAVTAHQERRNQSGTGRFEELEQEEANLTAAFTFFEVHREADHLLRMAVAISHYWYQRWSFRDSYRWLERAVQLGRSAGGSPELIAYALLACSGHVSGPKSHLQGMALLDEALGILRPMEESSLHGLTLTEYGGHLDIARDYLGSARRFAEAATVFRRIGDKFGETTALWNQSDVTIALGPDAIDEAARLAAEALVAALESGNADRIALTHRGVAQINLMRREWQPAREHLLASLDLLEGSPYLYDIAEVLVGFAGVAELLDNPKEGARLLGAARSMLERLGRERFSHQRMFEYVWATVVGRLDKRSFRQGLADGAKASLNEMIATVRALAELEHNAEAGPKAVDHGLSPREMDVLRLLCDGVSNQVIADTLFISRLTVKNHVTAILTKLNVSSRTAAVSYTHRHGLVGEH